MIEIFENVESIKLIDCPMYEEYSVIILFKEGKTHIIDLESSEEAETLYNKLNAEFKAFKSQKANKTSEL